MFHIPIPISNLNPYSSSYLTAVSKQLPRCYQSMDNCVQATCVQEESQLVHQPLLIFQAPKATWSPKARPSRESSHLFMG